MLIMCKWAAKLPQNSIFLEYPIPWMLLPGHPGGVSGYEQCFWTPTNICNLGQQGYLYTNTIQGTPKLWKFQNYDIDSRSHPPLLICAISHYPRAKLDLGRTILMQAAYVRPSLPEICKATDQLIIWQRVICYSFIRIPLIWIGRPNQNYILNVHYNALHILSYI